jgi:hypothetical protein
MAELSAADRRAILGPDYKPPEVTEESLAGQKADRRASIRNTAIALAVVAIIILLAIVYGGGR